jgi:hypothetical protein
MKEGFFITCPHCGQEFELSDALTGKIREHLKAELQQDVVRREADLQKKLNTLKEQEEEIAKARDSLEEQIQNGIKQRLKEIEEKATKKVEDKYTELLKELQDNLKERDEAIAAFREQERELRKKQRQLEDAQKSVDLEISRRLDEEREKLQIEVSNALEAKYTSQLEEFKDSLEQRDKAIKEFRQQEIALRKRQRELEEANEEAELEIARKLDEERAKIHEAAARKGAEEHRLKDLEKDKVINDLRASLEDMKRRAEQGSMEIQGEVLEQDFETQMKAIFPHDDIQPVPKGIRGADIIQCVRTPFGHESGIILWETKNTKAWSPSWIQKLKDDMISTRATLAILVSVALPEGITRFGNMDDIWVSDPLCALPLAAALREQLIAVSRERTISIGKNEKMEALYQYLSGTEFKQKIEGIVEAFTSMQDQLNRERRAMEKHWNQREKQIKRVIRNTAGLYGDMQGIIGGQMPTIGALELDDQTVKQLPQGPSQQTSQDLEEAVDLDDL